jgi:16S rRNA processing protein RimM
MKVASHRLIAKLLFFVLSIPEPFCLSWTLSTSLTLGQDRQHHHAHRRTTRARHSAVSSSIPDFLSTSPDEEKHRKKKKNKYAKFSKADKLARDPLEAMIAESEAMALELAIVTKKGHNKQPPTDESLKKEPRPRNQILFPDTRTVDPYDPTTYGYTELGTITGAHGVHGLLKIAAVTEFSERLCRPGVRHIKAQNRRSPRQIQLLEGRHRLGEEYLIRLEGIGDRDAANRFRGSVLFARQDERPEELEQDEYLVNDLVGLEVFLEEGYHVSENGGISDLGGRFVGIVGGILLAEEMCAVPGLGQDMLELILPHGPCRTASWRDELVLIPLVPQIVPRIDLKDRAIHITPPNGLLDLTYVREEKVRIKGFLPPGRS